MHKGWCREGFEQFQERRQPLVVELFKGLRSWAVRRADRIIVPSRYLKRFVVRWGVPEERCVVIYNAVEEGDDLHGEPPPLPGSFKDKVKIITVARLVPLKGVDLAIRAVSRLPFTALTVVGDGPLRSDLEELARKMGVMDRVWFAGARPKAEVLRLFKAHYIFVLASSHEGLPHVVLEAMYHQDGSPLVGGLSFRLKGVLQRKICR